MKIKIGNFNFINSKDNKLTSFNINPYDLEYFFLDGKEDTLFAESTYKLDYIKEGNLAYDNEHHKFEKELLEKYPKIINYTDFIKDKIDKLIQEEVEKIYKSQNYSRYDLYNNISIDSICYLEGNTKFKYGKEYNTGTTIDFDNNKIIKDGFIFNPYTLEIENLQKELENGRFKQEIKANLIKKEIQDRKAPKFVLKILEINEFIKGKKTVTIEATNLKPYKVIANLGNIIELRNNNIYIETWGNDFNKQNPDVERNICYKSELVALTFGKQVIQFAKGTFKNLEEQIATTPEDKFLFKMDRMSKQLNEKFRNFCNEYEDLKNSKGEFCHRIPYEIKTALKNVVNAKMGKEIIPEWYLDNKEHLDNFFEKYQALEHLKYCETISDIEEGLEAFPEDEELKQIIDEFDLDYDMGGYVFPKEELTEEDEDEPEM